MADAADLLASITAAPADDLPRLVYADWLEEHGEGDYAQFIRDQIRLSQVPAWDPFAIRSRHQLHDTLTLGKPFRSWLPELPPFMVWPADQPFHRGFGTKVVVTQLSGLLEAGEELFDLAPVDELWLSAATLDQWRALARSRWLKNVRKLHFHFSQGLYEPIRCLAESQYSGNIDEIRFDILATPAAGTVVEAVAESKLAEQLTGLHLRLVHVPSVPEIIDALSSRPFGKLERLSMIQAGFETDQYNTLCQFASDRNLQTLDLSGNFFNTRHFDSLFQIHCLKTVILNDSMCQHFFIANDQNRNRPINKSRKMPCMLSLSNYNIKYWGSEALFDSDYEIYSRCLNYSGCHMSDSDLHALMVGPMWPGLRELNLASNTFSDNAIKKLCRHIIPAELAAIQFTRSCLSDLSGIRLKLHFGETLVWSGEQAATGLAR